MAHTIEPAASGRAGCRGCGRKIQKGELRLGERLPNPYADEGEMTLWFHLRCAALKRPEVLLEALDGGDAPPVPGVEMLRAEAEEGLRHRRLPRLDGAERSPSGRASCRSCHAKIPKGAWRLKLVYFEEERFSPSGFLHPGCAAEYLGTADVLARAAHFSDELSAEERGELAEALAGPRA